MSHCGSRSRGWATRTTSTHLEDGLPLHQSLSRSPYVRKMSAQGSPYGGKGSLMQSQSLSKLTGRASTSCGSRPRRSRDAADSTRLPAMPYSASTEMLADRLSEHESRLELISQLQAELVQDRLHRKKLQTAESGRRRQVPAPQWPQWSERTAMPASFLPPVSSRMALQWRPQRQRGRTGKHLRASSHHSHYQSCGELDPKLQSSPQELLQWVDNLLKDRKGQLEPKLSLPPSQVSSQPPSQLPSRRSSTAASIAFTGCESLTPIPSLAAYDWLQLDEPESSGLSPSAEKAEDQGISDMDITSAPPASLPKEEEKDDASPEVSAAEEPITPITTEPEKVQQNDDSEAVAGFEEAAVSSFKEASLAEGTTAEEAEAEELQTPVEPLPKEDFVPVVEVVEEGSGAHVVPPMSLENLDHFRSASEVMGMSTDREVASHEPDPYLSEQEAGSSCAEFLEHSARDAASEAVSEPKGTDKGYLASPAAEDQENLFNEASSSQPRPAAEECLEGGVPLEIDLADVRRQVVSALRSAAQDGTLPTVLSRAEATAWIPSLRHSPSVASWYSSGRLPLLPIDRCPAPPQLPAVHHTEALGLSRKTPKGERVPPGQSVVMSESVGGAESEGDAAVEVAAFEVAADEVERGSERSSLRSHQAAGSQHLRVSFTRDSLTEEPSQELPTVVEEELETNESAIGLSHSSTPQSGPTAGSSSGHQRASVAVPWKRQVKGLGHEEALLYISEEKAVAAFTEMERDGVVKDVAKALHFMGHRFLEEDLLESVLRTTGLSRSNLGLEEFLKFVDAYQTARREVMEKKFREVDQDNSGRINEREISRLLRSTGITPLPGVVPALLLEVTGQKRRVSCDLEQFVKLFSVVSHRAGFTEDETEQLKEVFDRFETAGDGWLDTAEFQRLLSYMGFVTDPEVADELVQQVVHGSSTPDGSSTPGKMDFADFLLVMRKHREYEVARYQEIFSAQDTDMNGTISAEELEGAFEQMGYVSATAEVIEDCRLACGLHHVEDLLFEDFMRLLEEFRRAEGFTRAQLDALEVIYNNYGLGKDAGFSVLDLRDALQHLGYRLSHLQLQTVVSELDFIRIRKLTLTHWVKLVGKYRELDHLKVREAFLKQSASQIASIPQDAVRTVLVRTGVSRGDVEDFMVREQELVLKGNFAACLELYKRYQILLRDYSNDHEGFTRSEVQDLERRFRKLDHHHHGVVKSQYISNLLQDYFPMSRGRDTHLKARAMALEVEKSDANAPVDFAGLLKMVRKVQDEAEAESFEKQRGVLKASGFSAAEVEGFREIFKSKDKDLDGRLSFTHVKDVVKMLVPRFGADDGTRLREVLQELDVDHSRTLDFSEFLELMWRLQELGWAPDLMESVEHHGGANNAADRLGSDSLAADSLVP
eukprot:CAMPEP_0178388476 /NCGR_PEP_ID=MMETSP0689_2-20121128/9614_1 /TAXON_ID=160604 /ORGANISM="Amphidinium massartii, Strain CS-259" /LENGTH=1393 /DNA_ID=CAMNT_0020008883 /DNA_START=15 /DNA_END=4193 /DNA_ORIENTATION=-